MSMYEGGKTNGGVDWNAFDKYERITDKYLPFRGEGESMASQIVTAVNKLVYKWYNDGDVYDNTHTLKGWCNNLSTYANWLYAHAKGAKSILIKINSCETHAEYEQILAELADVVMNLDYLAEYEKLEKVDSIYDCTDGPFRFEERWD